MDPRKICNGSRLTPGRFRFGRQIVTGRSGDRVLGLSRYQRHCVAHISNTLGQQLHRWTTDGGTVNPFARCRIAFERICLFYANVVGRVIPRSYNCCQNRKNDWSRKGILCLPLSSRQAAAKFFRACRDKHSRDDVEALAGNSYITPTFRGYSPI